jgi:hypothetical protein
LRRVPDALPKNMPGPRLTKTELQFLEQMGTMQITASREVKYLRARNEFLERKIAKIRELEDLQTAGTMTRLTRVCEKCGEKME